jgi:hypothetical protein
VTSGYRADAALEVVGVGPLTYRDKRGDWYLNGGTVDGYANPVIMVRGLEGDVSVTPRPPTPRRE